MAVWLKRLKRYYNWYFDGRKYANNLSNEKLPFQIKKHKSVLLKKLGESDMQLQVNKVTNLKIAIKNIDGILIKPGETFSFCKLVGLQTKRKGYLNGMELSFGEVKSSIGGGICQISNMINWLIMHSPLTVTEIYPHSYDPFPDDERVLPFGSGATVFYNYHDYQFTNKTDYTFQINLWLTEKYLEGELRINKELDFEYCVIEKEHQFLKIDGLFFRKNEIWREKILKTESGKIISTELLTKNFARVTYSPESFIEYNGENQRN
ncbi:MAG: VanW family protein [Ignavibacteria bacterium]